MLDANIVLLLAVGSLLLLNGLTSGIAGARGARRRW
jgi:hypothetical protein